MRISGVGGEVRVGPRVAATLGAWALERPVERLADGAWVGTARIRVRDAYWSATRGPFDLVVPTGSVEWAWRGVGVEWGEQDIGITGIGKPEVRV